MKESIPGSILQANPDLLVSIVCVTLNAAKTLPRLINSIKEHKTAGIEFIVIDGGSSDGTIALLEANEALIDFWTSGPDDGIYDAINKSLNYANGKWLNFLGADDLLGPDFNKMLAVLQKSNAVYYGNVLFYGKEFTKTYNDYYLTKLNICHQAIFYPKSVFSKYRYDLKYRVYADYYLNLQCWKDPKFEFVHVNYLIASFSEGGYSTVTKDLVFERDRKQIFRKFLKPISYFRFLNRTEGFFKMVEQCFKDS